MTTLFVAVAVALPAAAARQEPLLEHSIVGSESCRDGIPCFGTLMENLAVQRFLLDLARAPVDVATADAALRRAGVAAQDLLALRLMRREGDRYALAFALFTADDVRRIRERSGLYAASLARAILERRGEIERALSAYDAPGVDRGAVAYFLLGCVSLDWDGLEITGRRGDRATSAKRPGGDFVPAAQEKTAQSLKGIYWGSHNARIGGTGFTSFGDHFSRRFAYPDLLWSVPSRIATRDGDPESAGHALQMLVSASLGNSAAQVARIMLALRERERTAAELAGVAALAPDEATALLDALAAIDYVGETDGRYRALVPVLTARDRALSDGLRRIGREVIERWLAAHYAEMRSQMADLGYVRSGVPFEEGFTMIWHYVFGITNRKLAEAGLFADPYAPGRRFKGAIPAVYSLEFSPP
ncbi:MAG: hypothetical protein ACM3PC_14120 [Deltaproteobacteria bacterium]